VLLILTVLHAGEALAGREDAFERLFRELYRPVMGFFAKRGCSVEDSQELAQETFLRAFKALDDFRGDAKSSTWLFAIATNLWRNRRRDAAAAKRDGAEVSLPEDDPADSSREEPPDQRAIEAERSRLLRAAVAELPPKMRRCVWLRVYQGRDYGDIAEILGVTVETAKSQVSLAKSRLRKSLGHRYPELEDDPHRAGG
jgi:RNA polymerase sigma-70 factor (ECF subfamily)